MKGKTGNELRQGYDTVTTVDGDDQHTSAEIAKFLAAFAADRGDIIGYTGLGNEESQY
jgi:hypothetical protein